jgi:N-acetylglucosamine malate deacetylase 1
MKTVLVVAPHPDDETLGCGGTLLRHIEKEDAVHWLIITDMRVEDGFSEKVVACRQQEIMTVAEMYGFERTHNLAFKPAHLEMVSKSDLINRVAEVVEHVAPEVVYMPFWGDVHSDHAIVFDAVMASTKWFRCSSVRRLMCYETLSESDANLKLTQDMFRPNSFMDVTSHLNKKIEIAMMYQSEMGDFPFPRSELALRSLAQLRGAASGCLAAEAFMLLKEIN